LQSKTYLPQWDKILNILFQLFIVLALTFTLGEYFQVMIPNNIYALVVNTATLILIIVILIIGFKSYLQKRREANYYLSALLLPLLLMLVLVFCLIVTTNNTGLNFLPNLAVLSITITFAVALVAKVNLIKEELNNEKLDKQKISASIAIEKERNIRLQEKIEYDKNEVAAAQHIKLLMKELHHRVKNNLQIVSSLLSLQSFRIKDQAAIDAVKEGQHRIEAMSLIHQKLYIQDNITQVNINEFITDIAESLMQAYGYNSKSFTLEIKVSEQLLEVDKAIPLSIIINELITNSFKYAYAGIEKPKLSISFTKQKENVALRITDNGTGIDLNAWQNNDGYGKELVHTFTEQLEGTLTLNVDSGTTFQIVFPL
jgi:two-component sensor histidine kinase